MPHAASVLAKFLKNLVRDGILQSLDTVTIIGFSIGATVAAETAEYFCASANEKALLIERARNRQVKKDEQESRRQGHESKLAKSSHFDKDFEEFEETEHSDNYKYKDVEKYTIGQLIRKY